jgi:hypothetical protein
MSNRWMAIALTLASLLGAGGARAQVVIETRVEPSGVAGAPSERFVLTLRNETPAPAYVYVLGGRLLGSEVVGSAALRCAVMTPEPGNPCLLDNPCSLDEFFYPGPICTQFRSLPPGTTACAWRVAPIVPGCEGDILEVRGFWAAPINSQIREFTVLQKLLGEAASIPTLSAWGVALLVMALAAAGLFANRGRPGVPR